MDYMLDLGGDHIWRFGRYRFHPGKYRVPEQMPDSVARRALSEGVGKKVVMPAPPPPVVEEIKEETPEADVGDTSPPRRRPGRPKKTPAPEDKHLGRAVENKSKVE